MSSKNSHALGYLAVFSFGMFMLGLVYQMLIGGRGFFGAVFMGLIFAGVIAAIIYLFLMTSHGKEWSKVAAKTIETKAGEVKAKVDQARESSAASDTSEPPASPSPEPQPEVEAAPVVEAVVADPVEAPSAPAVEEAPSAPVVEEKPATLDAPEGGVADDLKRIKGVGPKLEKVLNGMGYYHFHQIAVWGDKEVAWVDENLEGFKGRVSRDNWVSQAKDLAG